MCWINWNKCISGRKNGMIKITKSEAYTSQLHGQSIGVKHHVTVSLTPNSALKRKLPKQKARYCMFVQL
jgi:hypothetical protein